MFLLAVLTLHLIYTSLVHQLRMSKVRETHCSPLVSEIYLDRERATKLGFLSKLRVFNYSCNLYSFSSSLLELISVCNQELINTIVFIHLVGFIV